MTALIPADLGLVPMLPKRLDVAGADPPIGKAGEDKPTLVRDQRLECER